ncbi:hypothetical protein [Nostoc sp. FACHB-145]|uniref:hypothetical protein n=1 Tax=Nostoc sp. FACHB-145 TaxID=2692836 RepID=UPI0016844C0C|nr:hypothetical protein [Nostoc sp. FACHB-145]MBD2472159.1 hypothetical protein [Nostoc sp. FACHB-145]
MTQQQKKEIELPKIRKVPTSWDGKVIDYLLKHRSGRAATDLAIEAITSYWLVEALKGKVSEDEFQEACRAAAENLTKKLISIQQMTGLNNSTSIPSLGLPVAPATQPINSQAPQQQVPQRQEEENDEDDWNMNLQLTEEMMEVNQALAGID